MFFLYVDGVPRGQHVLTHSFPTRRTADLPRAHQQTARRCDPLLPRAAGDDGLRPDRRAARRAVPQPHPLYRHVLALSYRQRLVRRLRSEEHTSELQSLMRISYAVFCLKKTMFNAYSTSSKLLDSFL